MNAEYSVALFDSSDLFEELEKAIEARGGCPSLLQKVLQSKVIENELYPDLECLEEARKYRVVFWHGATREEEEQTGSPGERSTINSFDDLCMSELERDRVLIRTSYSGNNLCNSPGKNERSVFVLHLVLPGKDLTQENWNKILNAATDLRIVEDLVSGRGDPAIRRYFYRDDNEAASNESVPENAIALCVLCQGYLLAWLLAEPDAVASQTGNGLRKAVMSELAPEFDQFVHSSDTEVAQSRFHAARQSAWWEIFGEGMTAERLAEVIVGELKWESALSGHAAVRQLILAITNSNGLVEPAVVWEAYEALSSVNLR